MHLKHIRWNAGNMGHMPSDASLEIGLSFPIHGTFGFQLTIAGLTVKPQLAARTFSATVIIRADASNWT
jgi:hypothetical protein